MSKVAISQKHFSLGYTHPFVMYTYTEALHERVTVDFMVPTMSEEDFEVFRR